MVKIRLSRIYLAVFVSLFLLPLVVNSPDQLTILILCLIQLVLASSLTISSGYLGIFNAGHITFFGIGGYCFALLALRVGSSSFVVNIIISGIVAAAFSIVVGLAGIRVKGASFAVITLSSMIVAWMIALAWSDVTRGALGLPRIPPTEVFGVSIASQISYYYAFLIISTIVFLFLYLLISSRVGRTLVAIRENETLARSFGVNIALYKVLGFVIPSFFAGISGAMQVSFITYVDPNIFSLYYLVWVLAITALANNTLGGTLFTSFALTILPEALRATQMLRETILGIILIVLVLGPVLFRKKIEPFFLGGKQKRN